MVSILSKLYLVLYLVTAYIYSYKYTRLNFNRYHSLCGTRLYSSKSSVTASALTNSTGHELILDKKNIQNTTSNENHDSSSNNQVRNNTLKVSRYSDNIVIYDDDDEEDDRFDHIEGLTPSQKEYLEALAAKFTWTGPPPERHGKSIDYMNLSH